MRLHIGQNITLGYRCVNLWYNPGMIAGRLPRLLLRMLRYYLPSPNILLWRTIEVAVLIELAARHGLDLQAHVDLDVGCGNGALGQAFIRDIALGFDLTFSDVHWARHHKPAYRWLLQASATRMPLWSASQRIVLSNSVIEHIPDYGAALDEIARVIAPGGFLLLSTVSKQFPALSLGQARPEPAERAALDHSYAHFHYFSAAELREELEHRGFQLLDSAYYIDSRQSRWHFRLRNWERSQVQTGWQGRVNQARRAPLSLAVLPFLFPLVAPPEQGSGLAIIARRRDG